MISENEVIFLERYVTYREESLNGESKILINYPPLHSLLIIDFDMKEIIDKCKNPITLKKLEKEVGTLTKKQKNVLSKLIEKGVLRNEGQTN